MELEDVLRSSAEAAAREQHDFEKHQLSLEKKTQAMGLEVVHKVPEDGNCLWQSLLVIDEFEKKGAGYFEFNTFGDLKEAVLKHMSANEDDLNLRNLFDQERYACFENYFEHLEGDGHFGDELCILAYSHMRKLAIPFVSSDMSPATLSSIISLSDGRVFI
jgi:hypothetical protein